MVFYCTVVIQIKFLFSIKGYQVSNVGDKGMSGEYDFILLFHLLKIFIKGTIKK